MSHCVIISTFEFICYELVYLAISPSIFFLLCVFDNGLQLLFQLKGFVCTCIYPGNSWMLYLLVIEFQFSEIVISLNKN